MTSKWDTITRVRIKCWLYLSFYFTLYYIVLKTKNIQTFIAHGINSELFDYSSSDNCNAKLTCWKYKVSTTSVLHSMFYFTLDHDAFFTYILGKTSSMVNENVFCQINLHKHNAAHLLKWTLSSRTCLQYN